MSNTEQYVYFFGGGKAEGHSKMKNLLGGKGANLAEMDRIGIPVPAGFTLSTEVCTSYYQNSHQYPEALYSEVQKALQRVESLMGMRFGDPENPLLLSCRSGARTSMPGMMDTVLNIGLNDKTVEGLARKSNNPRFAHDAYRRFVAMYGDVVLGLKPEDREEDPFELVIAARKKKKGIKSDLELDVEDLKWLTREFKTLIEHKLKIKFPEDPQEQLWGAIGAVFSSWMTPRAQTYRRLNDIPNDWGTAVNVQAMVFGNMGEDSATGVAFSRDPSTGERYFYGEYLTNAQGEDVVAGIRTPIPINRSKPLPEGITQTLEEEMPALYQQLDTVKETLEKHYRDMQDMEFTIQQGRLWMLQTRNGKRTTHASIKIAVEMVREGLIDKEEAVSRINPAQLDRLLHPMFDPNAPKTVLAKGLPASPGAAVGQVVFSASEAHMLAQKGVPILLVRQETSPDDIEGMHVAQGILTSRGGMTSHAAVVARGMGTPCVAGVSEMTVNYASEYFTMGKRRIKKLDWISIDGSTGEAMLGKIPTVEPSLSGDFNVIMKWADEIRQLRVRANADTPTDAKVARGFGAEGIGLCRTEHMFFEKGRIDVVREMILSPNEEGRCKALAKILPMQRSDFEQIFRVMEGLPVTIRTLDPPLHEFLPRGEHEISYIAEKMGVEPKRVKETIDSLHEFNPMLGHRGCRLGITFPEITQMQVRAIMEAACIVSREGIKVMPEIMIPLVSHVNELHRQRDLVEHTVQEVLKEQEMEIKYLVGTMIELPRAAVTADKIAADADFFSFGTNDLTQTTFGLSRDDAGSFLPDYIKLGILERDPFVVLDREGVGEIMRIGIARGRSVKPQLKVGICGEHGGEPSSVAFCHELGMNYVSCSPFRVPIARMAAAQAVIREKRSAQ